MTEFSHADELVGLPGYLETLRLTHGTPGAGMFRPAWNRLELFSAPAAIDFLTPKLEKATQINDEEARIDALIEISLGFAIMSVFADRENNAYIEEMADRARQLSGERKAEREIEEEAIHGTPDIDW